jgi:hypothetical protein
MRKVVCKKQISVVFWVDFVNNDYKVNSPETIHLNSRKKNHLKNDIKNQAIHHKGISLSQNRIKTRTVHQWHSSPQTIHHEKNQLK